MKTRSLVGLLFVFVLASVATRDSDAQFSHVFPGGNRTASGDSGIQRFGEIYGVAQNGDLRWYQYSGSGESDRSGSRGWHPNSGNPVGNGWQDLRHVSGRGNGVILGVHPNDDLIWYRYDGNGKSDRSASQNWHPNSGDPIGNGWGDFQHVFGGGRVTYGVHDNGDLLWYRYDGNGESDRSGSQGWHPLGQPNRQRLGEFPTRFRKWTSYFRHQQ